MTATIACRHETDRAVVEFYGPITWPAVMELVATVDALVERYSYRRVELVLTSPGGLIVALEHVLRALGRWRARGIAVDTRVVAEAASAAAVLVALGDARTAEPGAKMLLHLSRVLDTPELTAHLSTHIHGELSRVDRELVDRLVDRALRSACAPPHAAEPRDRPVLERLASEATPTRRARHRRRSVRGLANTVGRAVDDAVDRGDEKALTRIYRALAGTEHPISAPLARTLRLVDHVGAPEAPVVQPPGPPGLTVPEWAPLYPPDGAVPRALLTRHTLVLGETGSGKTASAVLPLVTAMARAPRERLGTVLVIDPKREIAPVLERLAPQRLHRLDAGDLRLDLMAGPRWSLDADLAAGRWLTAARKVLMRVASLVPASPLHTLTGQSPAHGKDPFFDRQGARLALDVLAFVLMLLQPDAPEPDAWLGDDNEARDWLAALLARARGTGAARGPNLVALVGWAIDEPLVAALPDSSGSLYDSGTPAQRWLWSRIAARAFDLWAHAPGEARDLLRRIAGYWAPLAAVEKQHAGVLATASCACADFAAPAVANTLYFGCEPGAGDHTLDLARLVSPEGADGRLIVFQPARDALDQMLGVALKALLFEAVLADPDRARGDTGLPLVGYVADECHRFVTADPVHGEQSFLDTCRSFGAFCLLATQSVASIEHALSVGGASRATNDAATAIIWNNTATKLVFRCTDAATADRVAALCPAYPGWVAPLRVRPLSTLAPGECVAVLADGRVLREQLHPVELDAGTDAHAAGAHPPPRHQGRRRRRRPHQPARDGAMRTAAVRNLN